MTGSFKKIDYRIRPAKHAERLMLIDLFKRLRFAPSETYQYVGFGSVGFVDFRLCHRMLGIDEMVSIEATDDPDEQERFRRNVPFAGVDLRFGRSTAILPALDFSKKSFVWLDYDNVIARWMATDIATIVQTAASGTFIGVSFASIFPQGKEAQKTELARLKSDFPEFVARDAKASDYEGKFYAEFGRSTLDALLKKAISDADAGEADPSKRRSAQQVCYFRYKDGLPMVTVGWVVFAEAERAVLEESKLDQLMFYRDGKVALNIDIPLVTPHEVAEMERRLPALLTAVDLDWIPMEEKEAFGKSCRYLPRYATLETA